MITKTLKTFPARVGQVSCVGCSSTVFPVDFGNYMWISEGPYIVNMWAENLQEAAKVFNLTTVDVLVFSNGDAELGVICDKNIPTEWMRTEPYVCGVSWGSRELCESICEYMKYPVSNVICGCEKLDETPSISRMFNFRDRISRKTCHRCFRQW
jgi:hypothetical protein